MLVRLPSASPRVGASPSTFSRRGVVLVRRLLASRRVWFMSQPFGLDCWCPRCPRRCERNGRAYGRRTLLWALAQRAPVAGYADATTLGFFPGPLCPHVCGCTRSTDNDPRRPREPSRLPLCGSLQWFLGLAVSRPSPESRSALVPPRRRASWVAAATTRASLGSCCCKRPRGCSIVHVLSGAAAQAVGP